MALTLGDNFSYQGAKPLDGRLKYDTVAAMKAMADSTLYDGCLAYCVATDKTYQWKSTNTVDPDLGRWREFGGTVDSAISSTSENPVQNKVIKTALDGKADLVDGKIPASQLPSYVDDVIDGYYKNEDGKFYEESTYETEITPESGKIYISVDTEIQYRWTGSAYSPLGGALVLGETSSTAYRGDRGKTAYDISQTVGDVANLQTTAKNSVVAAVNEVKASIPDISGKQDILQFSTMPTASVTNEGNIVQYIGATDSTYTNGYFYECVSDGEPTPTYSWTAVNVQAAGSSISPYTANPEMNGTASPGASDDYARGDHVHPSDTSKQDVMQFSTMPAASASNAGKVVQFVGATDTYTNGYFYKCVENGGSYSWEAVSVQGSDSTKQNVFQFSTMPTAAAGNLGTIVQFIGTTGGGYTNGFFYKCVSDGESTPTYSWSATNVQAGGGSGTEEIFVGTIDEWNALSTAEKESYSLVLIKPKEFVVGETYTINGQTFICARELDDDIFAMQANTSWATVTYIRSGKPTGDRINVNLVDHYTEAANWYTSDVQAMESDDYKYGPHWVSVGDATSASYKYNDGLKAAYGWTGSANAGEDYHYAIQSDGTAVLLNTYGSPRSAGLAPAFNVDATKAVIGLNNVITAGTPEHIDQLYTYNSETGELESIPHRITSEEMSEIISPLPAAQRVMPVLFDETGAEYVVGWYKRSSDGKKKPLYQKTITVTTPSTINDTAVASKSDISSDLENIINIDAIVMATNGHRFTIPYYYSNGAQCNMYYATTGGKLNMGATGFMANSPCDITLQYIKTTDSWND